MARPTVDPDIIRAELRAALASVSATTSRVTEEAKRKAEEPPSQEHSKRLKSDPTEEGKTETKPDSRPQLDGHQTSDGPALAESGGMSGCNGGDLTPAIYGDDNTDEHEEADPSSGLKDSEATRKVENGDERQMESDALLVAAYREMSAASESMALWSKLTADALDAKLTWSRMEIEAAREVLQAQDRYDKAIERIGQAVAHRNQGDAGTSDDLGSA